MSKKNLEKIKIQEFIMDQIEEHCFSEVSHEVGGFLVGKVDGDLTEVLGAIRSTKAQSQRTSLTFTHEAWDEAYQALATNFPDLTLIGWYHSHPGFGVFMSEYDAFIQQNFFGATGQLALVVDPLAGRRGWFKWQDNEISTIHEEDTYLKALGGEAPDYVPPAAMTTRSSLADVPASFAVIGVVLVMLTGLIGFLGGQGSKSSSIADLENQIMFYSQQNGMLMNSAGSPMFIPQQESDPKAEVFYLRYAISNWDMMQSDLVSSIAFRFGITAEQLLNANPGLDLSNAVPNYLIIPVSGWREIPPALVTPGEEADQQPAEPESEPQPESVEEPEPDSDVPLGPKIPEEN